MCHDHHEHSKPMFYINGGATHDRNKSLVHTNVAHCKNTFASMIDVTRGLPPVNHAKRHMTSNYHSVYNAVKTLKTLACRYNKK